jgi:hypothetical protein
VGTLNVGELFVNLGIKGQDKTVGAISGVKNSLGEAKSMAIETKAGILAVVYGLEQLMSASMQAGTSLSNFETLVGVSTDKLQEYQFVARQVGGTNEEMANSFKSIQDKMSAFGRGEGNPAALNYMASKIGGYDPSQFRNPEYMLQQFQKFAQLKDIGEDMKRWALGSMGIGEHIQVAMMRGKFNPAEFAKAPKYSNAEAHRLDRMRADWSNLGTKVEMAIGHFNAQHGAELIKGLSDLTTETLKFANSLATVSEKFGAFEKFNHVIEGTANSLRLINEIYDKFNGKESKPGDLLYTPPHRMPKDNSTVGDLLKDATSPENFKATVDALKNKFTPNEQFQKDFESFKNWITPQRVPPTSTPKQDIEINQTLHFQHDGKEHAQTQDSTKRAVQHAFRALSAQGQVN